MRELPYLSTVSEMIDPQGDIAPESLLDTAVFFASFNRSPSVNLEMIGSSRTI